MQNAVVTTRPNTIDNKNSKNTGTLSGALILYGRGISTAANNTGTQRSKASDVLAPTVRENHIPYTDTGRHISYAIPPSIIIPNKSRSDAQVVNNAKNASFSQIYDTSAEYSIGKAIAFESYNTLYARHSMSPQITCVVSALTAAIRYWIPQEKRRRKNSKYFFIFLSVPRTLLSEAAKK
jgi:hypothetical protein